MEKAVLNKIVSAVIQQLRETKNGTQTCTSQLVDSVLTYKTFSNGTYFYEECKIEDMDFFEIDRNVREQASKEGMSKLFRTSMLVQSPIFALTT